MLRKERKGESIEKPKQQGINPEYFECPNCGHNIDNHGYKGCSVKRCKCKLFPSAIVISNLQSKPFHKELGE